MSRAVRDQQRTRWQDFLLLANSDPAATRQALFDIASNTVLQRSQDALAVVERELAEARAEGAAAVDDAGRQERVERLESSLRTQRQLVANARDMRQRGAAGSAYADDEYVRIILEHFGVPYTLVTQQKEKDAAGNVTLTRNYVWEKDVPSPVLTHHNHALFCSNFDQNNAQAVQGHWQSGLAKPHDLGFDLTDKFIYINKDVPFCQWRNTPRDGNCTIHAIFEVLTAASAEACQVLGLDANLSTNATEPSKADPEVVTTGSATPAATAASAAPATSPPVTTPTATVGTPVAAARSIMTPGPNAAEQVRIEDWLVSDSLIELATKEFLRAKDLNQAALRQLGNTLKRKYAYIRCIDFDETTSKKDCVQGIATLAQAMNQHTRLSAADARLLVANEIGKLLDKPSLAKTSIFAALEKSRDAQVVKPLARSCAAEAAAGDGGLGLPGSGIPVI
jgi:hypothetical protein